MSQHGHSHGGQPCHRHPHAHSYSYRADDNHDFDGPVADDPSLLADLSTGHPLSKLEKVDGRNSNVGERADGYDDVLGSGSLLIKTLRGAPGTLYQSQNSENRSLVAERWVKVSPGFLVDFASVSGVV